MERKDLTFTFDPTDLEAMRKLMAEHGDSNTVYVGMNTELEETRISILHNKIIYITLQHNGWIRANIYWHDGTREETFGGRWADQ